MDFIDAVYNVGDLFLHIIPDARETLQTNLYIEIDAILYDPITLKKRNVGGEVDFRLVNQGEVNVYQCSLSLKNVAFLSLPSWRGEFLDATLTEEIPSITLISDGQDRFFAKGHKMSFCRSHL